MHPELAGIRVKLLDFGLAGVLMVQASSGSSADIGIFADALRTLCLANPPEPLTAGVLKGVKADLPLLLERDIADPSEIDAQAARQRLMGAVQSTLLGSEQPTLVLLEDLQWAGRTASKCCVSLAGSRRRDRCFGSAPTAATSGPSCQASCRGASCSRFPACTGTISRGSALPILGEGRVGAQLLDWLTAQSEGNSFFITEAMRAIAEEAGSLDAVGVAPLPQRRFTMSKAAAWLQGNMKRRLIARRFGASGRATSHAAHFIASAVLARSSPRRPCGQQMIQEGVDKLRQCGARWDVDTISRWSQSQPQDASRADTKQPR